MRVSLSVPSLCLLQLGCLTRCHLPTKTDAQRLALEHLLLGREARHKIGPPVQPAEPHTASPEQERRDELLCPPLQPMPFLAHSPSVPVNLSPWESWTVPWFGLNALGKNRHLGAMKGFVTCLEGQPCARGLGQARLEWTS